MNEMPGLKGLREKCHFSVRDINNSDFRVLLVAVFKCSFGSITYTKRCYLVTHNWSTYHLLLNPRPSWLTEQSRSTVPFYL